MEGGGISPVVVTLVPVHVDLDIISCGNYRPVSSR